MLGESMIARFPTRIAPPQEPGVFRAFERDNPKDWRDAATTTRQSDRAVQARFTPQASNCWWGVARRRPWFTSAESKRSIRREWHLRSRLRRWVASPFPAVHKLCRSHRFRRKSRRTWELSFRHITIAGVTTRTDGAAPTGATGTTGMVVGVITDCACNGLCGSACRKSSSSTDRSVRCSRGSGDMARSRGPSSIGGCAREGAVRRYGRCASRKTWAGTELTLGLPHGVDIRTTCDWNRMVCVKIETTAATTRPSQSMTGAPEAP